MAYLLKIDSMRYSDYLALKENLHKARYQNLIDDTWLLSSHYPGVFTLGRSFHRANFIAEENEIKASGREIIEIDRGGDITYHGPSQIMIYPFITVPNRDVEILVRNLEEIVMELLSMYNLKGERNTGYPGVWCNKAKIASIGLSVRKWVTYHGVAFNYLKDDGGFDMIVPCGIKGIRMTSLQDEISKIIDKDTILSDIAKCIEAIFNCKLNEITESELKESCIKS